MSMQTPQTPDPDDELQHLAPLMPLLFEGFEIATERACQFFEAESKPVNGALFAPLVRYHVREFLQDKGQVVDDFDREEMFNNGLCVTFGTRRIRMWKADDDTLPPPGSSLVKQSFLSQQLSWSLLDGQSPRLITLNLVILWNVDGQYRLSTLYLVCPKWAPHEGLAAEAYWARAIPHPATSIDAVQRAPSETKSKDLPIEIYEAEVADIEEAQ